MALVEYERRGAIALITLNNPPANAYSYELNRELDDAILQARFDDDAHVIVLRGSGDRFFCAGADIAMLGKLTPAFKYHFCLHANETLLRLEHTPKLVIAALNGHCVGGGLEIAMAADLRIGWTRTARPDATAGDKPPKQPLVGLPEVKLGVLPGTGGTQRLTRLVGKAKAIELLTAGENMSVAEAIAAGIVTRAFEAPDIDTFMAQVLEFAGTFAPPRRASLAVGLIKRACQTGAEVGLEQGLALERELQQRLFQSADASEGIAAFVEGREPKFTGEFTGR